MQLSIEGTARRIGRDLGALPALQKKATVTALNRTNAKLFTRAKRAIASEVGIPQKHVARQIRRYGATRNRLSVKTFVGLRARPTLYRVQNGRLKKGTSTRYLRGTLHGKAIEDVFVAKVPAGRTGAHTGFFVRKFDERLPIDEVAFDLTSSVAEHLEPIGRDAALVIFPAEMTREMKRRLGILSSAR